MLVRRAAQIVVSKRMQSARNLPSIENLGEDLSSLRTLFARSFPFQETTAPTLIETASNGSASSVSISEEFDWSITLENINELAEVAKTSEIRIKAAEERAIVAEAKAVEAELWLRRLHQAVLNGLSHRTPSR